MDIFSFFTLFGGLAFFLYGMTVMSKGLEKMAGGKLETVLKAMTSSKLKSLLLGAGITIAIQSSSAMTVMLVGLVNSGIMQLGQTIGVIMGSNIGTTLTAWLLSLSGIQSDNIFLKLLKPTSFAPIVAIIGIILIMTGKKGKKKDIGNIMVGFSILMFGMTTMGDAVSPLADIPEFQNALIMFRNPIIGVLAGTIITAVIQSSAASVGILQAISLTGGVTYGVALPIIMGQNIGTCVTSVLSAIGANKNAKRVAAVHIYFNVIGTVICLLLFYAADAIFNFAFKDMTINPFGIAICHSVFNVFTTVVLLPFTKQLEKLACLTIREKKEEKETYVFLDERLLLSPAFAINECQSMTVKMAKLSHEILCDSLNLIYKYDEKSAQSVVDNEDLIDDYEDKLGTFLVKLSTKELSNRSSEQITELLHSIGDFERIGDHALNIAQAIDEMHEKKIAFSEQAMGELDVIINALREILDITFDSFINNDYTYAAHVEPLEQVIDDLRNDIKMRHIKRLQQGQCTIELGFILSDLLANFERVSDHCSNIAVCLIQIRNSSYDTHEYLNDIKTSGEPHYVSDFSSYQQKYSLPKARV
ncbi:MAG: Na/Pi cotransporter family protein [Eubacteriales bacterium]